MGPRANLLHVQTVWLAVVDGICLFVALFGGVLFRDWLGEMAFMGFTQLPGELIEYIGGHLSGWLYFCGSIVLANYVAGSYGVQVTTSKFNLMVNWSFALLFALFILSVTSYAWFQQLLGRGVLAIAILFYGILSLLVKTFTYAVVLRSDFLVCRTVVIGTGVHAREIGRYIARRHILPRHSICGYLVCDGSSSVGHVPANDGQGDLEGVPVLRVTPETLEKTVMSLGAHLVVVAVEQHAIAQACYVALRRLRFGGIEVADTLTIAENYGGRVPLDLVDDGWLMQASLQPSLAVVGRFKRLFDLFVVIGSLPLWVPASLVIALLVKLFEPMSPVFFVQDRVGQFGRVFRIYKFRTMKSDAAVQPAEWAGRDDRRVTTLGRVLRKFRLDEIPQLVNILNGDMSFVGPRPEQPRLAEELERRIPYFRERENVPPGLTGWAQVQYPYTDNVEDAAKKLEFDLYYIKNLSLRLDLQIILRTFRIVVLGKEREM